MRILWDNMNNWVPHMEYMFTWAKIKKHFLLAGVSHELEWGEKNKTFHCFCFFNWFM